MRSHGVILRSLLGAVAALLVGCLGYAFIAPLEAPHSLPRDAGTVVLDGSGVVLSRDASAGTRIPIPLGAVAPTLIQATIAAEDRRFRLHPGVDPLAIARALFGEGPSGASTITQQLARRLYLADDDGPALIRKIREIGIALQLEARLSKDQILELYLNDVYYGRQAYGVEAAARAYFGSAAGNLDLAQASYLAGLPQRPSALSSDDDSSARSRQRYVLERMVGDGVVSRADADAAAQRPLQLSRPRSLPVSSHFVALALGELAGVRPDLAAREDLIVETGLDYGLQSEIERLMRLRLRDLADRNVTNAALVAIEPANGRILAYVGGATDGDAAHGGAIDMALARRQPGSALKPFLYAAGLERGMTPSTPLLDVASSFSTDTGPYTPLNYDRSFHGAVSLRVALASSLNVPAVRTLDSIGIDSMLEMTRRFGLDTLSASESYGLSLALGGGEVRLLDLTAAYAALAAEGRRTGPYAVTRVRDGEGRVLYERVATPARRVLSGQHAYLLADILSDPDARIPGFGGITPFDLPFAAAVKSGTTTGYRDNWTVGYTPEIAIGVWVGNANGSPMVDVSGVAGAGPIWRDAMVAASLQRPLGWFARPDGLVEATVCARTGLLPGPDCPSPTRELFVAGTEPSEQERYYGRTADGGLGVDPPADALAWAREAGLSLAGSRAALPADALRVVQPLPGTVLWIAPELGEQRVLLRAAAAPGVERVTFSIDGREVGEADAAAPWVVWNMEPGRHTLAITARLASGEPALASSTFEVRK